MSLSVVLGTAVNALVDGHSTVNGALIPDTATVVVTTSDPAVATVPATVAVPAGGAQEIVVPVTGVAVGSCTISVAVSANGANFTASDTLTITAAAVAVLDHVSLTLVSA